ncbi:unnamed protein product [Allacma fusca]|uniref:EF-hand domain-containing protein n=1 Tax=Allacma fusca TaxID=39272 RepID=A0A8J2JG99_9HEXA|nr:unnamed protein product [Allacma fusca]
MGKDLVGEGGDDLSRLTAVFNSLDTDGNGRIDIQELTDALQKSGDRGGLAVARRLLLTRDADSSGDISLPEFINYAKNHEKNLRIVFSKLDRNQDGIIDSNEIISAFHDIGISLKPEEAKAMIRRIAEDGSVEITWEEWRDYLILSPSADLHDVFRYWRHATPFLQMIEWILVACSGSEKHSSNYPKTLYKCRLKKYLDVGEDTAVPDDFTPDELASGQWWRHLVAGGIAGMVSRTSTAPLDRVKVFLQVHGCAESKKGLVNCMRGMLREGGWTSLWRGNGVNVIKIAPESALKFMAYEQLKRFIKGNSEKDLRISERFIAGSIAGAFSQSVIYPLEVIKTRLALRKTGEYTSVFDLTSRMLRNEGFRVFYRGYIPNLLGILPYAGIDLAVYETLKNIYSDTNQPSVFLLLTCGTVSSACGQLASYPLALVRTRLQASTDKNANRNMRFLFGHILKTEGFVGLYRGLLPNFLKVAPAVSISYVVYERVRTGLGVKMT